MSIPLALHSWTQAEAALTGAVRRGRPPTVASALTLRIPELYKSELRRELENRGYSWASLFPDPEGFRTFSEIVASLEP
jgi:hypothetical protein